MNDRAIDLAALRARCNQEFDGEAHLTNEELLALVDAVEEMKRHERILRSRYISGYRGPVWLPKAVVKALAKFADPPWKRTVSS